MLDELARHALQIHKRMGVGGWGGDEGLEVAVAVRGFKLPVLKKMRRERRKTIEMDKPDSTPVHMSHTQRLMAETPRAEKL